MKNELTINVVEEKDDGGVILAINNKIYFYKFLNREHWKEAYWVASTYKRKTSGVRKLRNKGKFLSEIRSWKDAAFENAYKEDIKKKYLPERSIEHYDCLLTYNSPHIHVDFVPKLKL